MRPVAKEFTLRSIQAAFDELSRAVTSLMSSRSSGVNLEDHTGIEKPSEGRLGFNRSTGRPTRFDGDTWVDI
jgi:hypothetical protein